MEKIRTRFAPSPTGFMHIGNLRAALFEYLVTKSQDGDFILRIEDTDKKRYVKGAVDFIYDTLSLCNIKIDEGPKEDGKYGPYIQSERLEIYEKYALKLIDMGKAYYCFCTEERLNKLREEAERKKVPFLYDGYCKSLSKGEVEKRLKNGEKHVIRQVTPNEGETSYNDLVYGPITIENKFLEDQILIKSDGYPTYNFANVIDDHLMGITHVIRGNEYLSSTPKYNLLYDAFGWDKPQYIHLPHIIKENGKKLSKREKDVNFIDLYQKGYLPEAIINYLVLLGWSSKTNQEIYNMDELIKSFDIKRITKSPAIYDIKKLNWVNSNYIKKLDIDKLLELTLPHLKKEYKLENKIDWVKELVLLYQPSLSYGAEIIEFTKLFFNENINLDEESKKIMQQEGADNIIEIFKNEIKKISDWTIDNINLAIKETKEKSGFKGKMLYMPIRIKVTGQMHGPELPNTIHLLGKELVLKRLSN